MLMILIGFILGASVAFGVYTLMIWLTKKNIRKNEVVGTLGIPESAVTNLEKASQAIIKVINQKGIYYYYCLGTKENYMFGATFDSNVNFKEICIIGGPFDGPRLCSIIVDEINLPIRGTVNIVTL